MPASTISPANKVCVPKSTDWRTSHSIQARASSKIGAPVVPGRTVRPFKAPPSRSAGLENFTKTRVSSDGQRLTVNDPPALINRCVTDLLSMQTPISTGSIESWVTHEAVIPFHSSPDAEPTRTRALGIFHVTLLISSESTIVPSRHSQIGHPNLHRVRILIATTGVLPAAPVADLCGRLRSDDGSVTVMTVVQVPRSFLEALDDDVRRSFLDDSSLGSSDAEAKAARYLEERGQKAVQPIVAGLKAAGMEADIRFVEGDDPAEAIIGTAEDMNAELVMMGATRRLFTEEAWRSVSARVMEKSHLPVLLVPGPRFEDTQEMPAIEL